MDDEEFHADQTDLDSLDFKVGCQAAPSMCTRGARKEREVAEHPPAWAGWGWAPRVHTSLAPRVHTTRLQADLNEDYVLVRRLAITRGDAVRSMNPLVAVRDWWGLRSGFTRSLPRAAPLHVKAPVWEGGKGA